jgi:hypothetical protein
VVVPILQPARRHDDLLRQRLRPNDESGPWLFQLKNEGASTYGAYDPTDEIQDSYFWNNTYNGDVVDGVYTEVESEPYVIVGVNYWLREPGSGDAIHPSVPLAYPHPRIVADEARE